MIGCFCLDYSQSQFHKSNTLVMSLLYSVLKKNRLSLCFQGKHLDHRQFSIEMKIKTNFE